MPIDERWDWLEPSDWDAFAHSWLAELRGAPESPDSDVGQSVVMMNFTAGPEHQWRFIRAAVGQAESDEELGHIAAGPMEHLMGWHGPDYIDAVEAQAATDPNFARMLGGVWKYTMDDEVWVRVQALKTRYPALPGPATDEPIDMDALANLSRLVKDSLRELIPDWQARGLIDESWLQEYQASLDDPMRPPPPPPQFGSDDCGDAV